MTLTPAPRPKPHDSRCRASWLLLLLAMVLVVARPAAAARLVILTMDGLEWPDVSRSDTPFLYRTVTTAAVGLMNCGTAGRMTPVAAAATIGAGARAVTGPWRNPHPDDGAPLTVPLSRLMTANRRSALSTASLGLVGDMLHHRRLVTGYIGCGSPALLVIADHAGRVDRAWELPHGNHAAALTAALDAVDVLLVDADRRPRDVVAVASWLRRGDRLAQSVVGAAPGAIVLICAPASARGSFPHQRLTPVWLLGPTLPAGQLMSPSTRRPGLLLNIDIAPTIARLLAVPSRPGAPDLTAFGGHALRIIPAADARQALDSLDHRSTLQVVDCVLAVALLFTLHMLAAAAALGGLLFARSSLPRYAGALRTGLLLAIAAPAALLLLAVGYPDSARGLVLATIAGAYLIASVIRRTVRTDEGSLVAVLALVAALPLLDLCCGAPLMKYAVLSYRAASEFRFYGIGNESVGLVLGGALMLAGVVCSRCRRVPWTPLVAGAILVPALIGHPALGANWGGSLTAAFAGCLLVLHFACPRMSGVRRILISGGWAAIWSLLLLKVASLSSSPPTHLGAAYELLCREGFAALAPTVARKIQMQEALMRSTPFTWVLLVAVIVVWWLLSHPHHLLQRLQTTHPLFVEACLVCLATSLAAFICNDSGITMVATMDMTLGATVLYMLLDLAGADAAIPAAAC